MSFHFDIFKKILWGRLKFKHISFWYRATTIQICEHVVVLGNKELYLTPRPRPTLCAHRQDVGWRFGLAHFLSSTWRSSVAYNDVDGTRVQFVFGEFRFSAIRHHMSCHYAPTKYLYMIPVMDMFAISNQKAFFRSRCRWQTRIIGAQFCALESNFKGTSLALVIQNCW